MNNKHLFVKRTFKIEKRNNSPNVIYFQHYDIAGFYAPKYIYVAFSSDGKKEYKAQSREEIMDFIFDNMRNIEFQKLESEAHGYFYAC